MGSTVRVCAGIFCRALVAMFALIISVSLAAACVVPEIRTDELPSGPDDQTSIKVSVAVVDFMGVDDVGQQLDIDFFLRMSWQDPRLAGLAGCRFKVTDVWFPQVRLLNSSNLRTAFRNARDEVAVGENGQITYVQRYTGAVSSYHNLSAFPFDAHEFRIDIGLTQHDINEANFIADPSRTWISDRLNIEGWDVRDVSIETRVEFLEPAELDLSVVTLTISAKRQPDFYLYRIMLLLTFVVGMSWVIFWVPPSRFEFQIGIGATSMLTAIAFNLAIAGQLPPVGYLTTMDKMIVWSIMLIFLSIIEALIAGRMVLAGNETRALRLDRVCRIAFPAAFFVGWYLMAL